MPNKAYLEITNVCNLKCSFCHGTKRAPRFVSVSEFETAAKRLRPFADYLYFHLMGEPLLHPQLDKLFETAADLGFKVIITTNGTLLAERASLLLSSRALHKLSVSVHSFEANDNGQDFSRYLESCFSFCNTASAKGIICVLRLWNLGVESKLNDAVIAHMRQFFSPESGCTWEKGRSGYKIKPNLYLEWGKRFEWPDIDLPIVGGNHGCYGLRDQVGVLCDGTVVPCCLDAEGEIKLGNIFESTIEEILSSDKAVRLKAELQNGKTTEPLCMRCGFAQDRFGK